MKKSIFMIFCCSFCCGAFLCAPVLAQIKISGVMHCDKPNPEYAIPVGNREGHRLLLQETMCTWTKPLKIEGSQTDYGTDTGYSGVLVPETRATTRAMSPAAPRSRLDSTGRAS